MIPENVIDALLAVRETSRCNMFSAPCVIWAVEQIDRAAGKWMRDNPDLYMSALNQMGKRVK